MSLRGGRREETSTARLLGVLSAFRAVVYGHVVRRARRKTCVALTVAWRYRKGFLSSSAVSYRVIVPPTSLV